MGGGFKCAYRKQVGLQRFMEDKSYSHGTKTLREKKWHFNMADTTSGGNSSFPNLNPHFSQGFQSRCDENAPQLLKGSYTFCTL